MLSHRRGRSLSQGLTLEESEKGELVISSIDDDSSASRGLREGDEIVGAAINFDELTKEEVLKVLKLMEPFDDRIQVLTKNNLSKSLGNLDKYTKSPGEMLKDSYNRLYNGKIKKFMKEDSLGAEGGFMNGKLKAKRTLLDSSKLSLKDDLPRLGVDFGVLQTKTLSSDNVYGRSSDRNGQDLQLSGTLPEGPNVNAKAGSKVPNIEGLSVGMKMPNLERPQIGLGNSGTFSAPDIDMALPKADLKQPHIDISGPDISIPDIGINPHEGNVSGPTFDISAPKVDIKETDKKFKMPKFKLPDLGLSGPTLSGPECDIHTPDISATDVSSGEISARSSKKLKNPDLNVDDPSSYVELQKVKLSNLDLNGEKTQIDLTAPDIDVVAPSGKFKMPKFGLSGKRPDLNSDVDIKTPNLSLKTPKIKSEMAISDINLPKGDLKAPELDIDTPEVDIKAPSGKFKVPKFTMPKIGLSGSQGINGSLEGPDVNLATPKLKTGIAKPNVDINGPSADLKQPNLDIGDPTGRFKMPNSKMPDFKVQGPDYELKTPDLDLSAPKFKKGISLPDIDLPDIDLKDPKVDLNAPDADINMPSGKLNLDSGAPSGKLKMPKFKLFGTLPRKKDLDIDAGMKTPNLTLKSPKIKGIDAPDMNVPNMDLKAPNLDLHSPGVNIGSPNGKFKTPQLKMPGPKGPNIGVDGDVNRPDLRLPSGSLNVDLSKPEFDIDTPSLNLKGPKTELKMPDANIGSPSGKFKMPNFTMPDFGLSGPNVNGPDSELKTLDFDLSAPKFKGAIGSSDLNLPEMDLNQPKLDLAGPGIKLDRPSGKFKVPTLKKPNFDLNAPDMNIDTPSGKVKMPKFNLSGTLPKGPNLDINTDLKSPDWSLKAPKVKGGIDAPDLDIPNMGLKAPNLNVNTPDVDIGSPKAKFKMPKLKMPKFNFPSLKGPDIDGNLDGPNVNLKGSNGGLEMPDVDFGRPSGKFKSPDLDATLPKGPNLNLNTDLKTPDLRLKAPKIKGGIDAPDMDLPNMDLKAPKLDLNTQDVNIGSRKAKFKMPKLKMLKFDVSSPKGPNVDIDGDLQGPDLNIPNVDSPQGKFKMPSLNMPDLRGPKLDLNDPDVSLDMLSGRLRVPTLERPKAEINVPDIDIKAPSSQIKMPKMPKFGHSGSLPKGEIDTPNLNLKASNLRGSVGSPDLPAVDLGAPKFDVDVLDVDISSPSGKLNIPKMPKFGTSSVKILDLGINGNMEGPDMNFTTPKAKAGITGPDIDMNVPSGNIQGPQTDFDLSDRKFKLPSLKLPQFGSPDLNGTGSDIDFGPSLRAANLDISPPNAKVNIKTPDLKGKVTGPKVSSPNVDLSMPKADIQGPQLHIKAPGLDIDAPSLKYKGSSHKKRRSNITGANVKMPVLDIDADVKLRHTDRKSAKTKARSSYPLVDSHLPRVDLLGHNIDFNRSDLNIDDFTGKDHVLKARGSKLDLTMPEIPGVQSGPNRKASVPKHKYGQGYGISPSGINVDLRDHKHHRKIPPGDIYTQSKHQSMKQPVSGMRLPNVSQDSKAKLSDNADGYYVTVFPKQAQNERLPNRKFNTLGQRDFNPPNVDLEVPDETDLKGSTFFFSNLI